jgi:hypothetical protein
LIRLLHLLLLSAVGQGMLNLAASLLRAAGSPQRTARGRAICYFSTAETVEGREYEQFAVQDENVRRWCAALAGDDPTTTRQ